MPGSVSAAAKRSKSTSSLATHISGWLRSRVNSVGTGLGKGLGCVGGTTTGTGDTAREVCELLTAALVLVFPARHSWERSRGLKGVPSAPAGVTARVEGAEMTDGAATTF
mmetsp:Transcript_46078/g.110403  ORF Transcript_46078/g.110403 Transcript_46078/m.110403 type:complete len:110 (+) Transcript_46078:677-1006(+)